MRGPRMMARATYMRRQLVTQVATLVETRRYPVLGGAFLILLALGLVMASWALRPASRTLATASDPERAAAAPLRSTAALGY